MKAEPIKFISRPMLMTLFVRTEEGQEIEIELSDDILMAMAGSHDQTSYAYSDGNGHTVGPEAEEITCLIEGGRIIEEEVIPPVVDSEANDK